MNDTTYWARSKATDSYGLVGGWSAWRQFTVDTTTPTVPAIVCAGYGNGQWYETPPAADTTCTISATGADIDWKVNSTAETALTLSGGSATTPSISVPASGYTHIEGRSRTRSGAVSAWTSYAFGTGGAALTEPIKDDRSTSTFPLKAAAPPGSESAKIQLPNLRDDIAATITIGDTGIDAYSGYTEFGLARDPANAPNATAGSGSSNATAPPLVG